MFSRKANGQPTALTDATATQAASFIAALISTILMTIGVLMMGQECATKQAYLVAQKRVLARSKPYALRIKNTLKRTLLRIMAAPALASPW